MDKFQSRTISVLACLLITDYFSGDIPSGVYEDLGLLHHHKQSALVRGLLVLLGLLILAALVTAAIVVAGALH